MIAVAPPEPSCGSPGRRPPTTSATSCLATPSDFDRLGELEPYGRGSRHRTYVENDRDWLFVACHGERVVATRRMSLVLRDEVIARVLRLELGQVWGADVFCPPEYCSRGIARQFHRFDDRFLVLGASAGLHRDTGTT